LESPEEWIKFNLDSGAAVSASPLHFGSGSAAGNGKLYKAADGAIMQDAGGVRMKLEDEYGGMRTMSSRVLDVHKNLTSASVAAKAGTNSWLTEGGGYMLPKSCETNRKIEKLLEIEAAKATSRMLPLYEEKGVYNFYLKVGKNGSIAPLEDAASESPEQNVKALAGMIKKLGEKEQKALRQELPGFPRQP
jgi:hypothetical protein